MTAPTDAERESQAVDRLTATFTDINGVHAAAIRRQEVRDA